MTSVLSDLFSKHNQVKSRNKSPLIPGAHIIETPWKRQFIIETVYRLYGLTRVFKFNPAPQPVSLSLSDLPLLKKESYKVTEKTDGIRYLMLLIRYNNQDEPVCIMMTRKFDMYEIPVICSEVYFQGTLVDGELVWEYEVDPTIPPRQLFYVFDIIACAGESLVSKPFLERIKMVTFLFDIQKYDILLNPRDWIDIARVLATKNKIICEGNQYALQFRPKQFYNVDELEEIWKRRDTLKHSNDGLIFMPSNESIHIGTDWSQFKWKPHNTIDLLWVCQCIERPENYPTFTDSSKLSSLPLSSLVISNRHNQHNNSKKARLAIQQDHEQQYIWNHTLYYKDKAEFVDATVQGITVKDPHELSQEEEDDDNLNNDNGEEMAIEELKQSIRGEQEQKEEQKQPIQKQKRQRDNPYRKVPMILIPSKYVKEVIHWHEKQNIYRFEYVVECECRLPQLSEYFDDQPIIECLVLKLRLDKSHPNNRYTVERTLQNCAENITIRDLIKHVYKS